MKFLLWMVLPLWSFSVSSAFAATACPAGFQPRGETCISQRISDFIACVEASGGNKQTLYNEIASSQNSGGGGQVEGSASGLIVKGGGTVTVDKKAEERLNNTLSSTFFDNAMDTCRKVLDVIPAAATPPITPPPAPSLPPLTVPFKICRGEYERACQPHDVYMYCYADLDQWAKSKCASYSISRYSTYGGNKCGYAMDLISCTGPR